eukprot:331586-Chlamydomonas_euryale.AAC.6
METVADLVTELLSGHISFPARMAFKRGLRRRGWLQRRTWCTGDQPKPTQPRPTLCPAGQKCEQARDGLDCRILVDLPRRQLETGLITPPVPPARVDGLSGRAALTMVVQVDRGGFLNHASRTRVNGWIASTAVWPKQWGKWVEAEIVEELRGPKVIVYKMRPKKHYRRKQGHRQELTKFKLAAVRAVLCAAVLCAAVRCVAVRCAAVCCAAVRCAAVHGMLGNVAKVQAWTPVLALLHATALRDQATLSLERKRPHGQAWHATGAAGA